MKFKLDILSAIYLACKAERMTRLISPDGVSYLISLKSNALVISSKTGTMDIDTSWTEFLESKIGKATKQFTESGVLKKTEALFFMIWDDFNIDEI
jgi:hypothetical protein